MKRPITKEKRLTTQCGRETSCTQTQILTRHVPVWGSHFTAGPGQEKGPTSPLSQGHGTLCQAGETEAERSRLCKAPPFRSPSDHLSSRTLEPTWREATTGGPPVLINDALRGAADRDHVHVSDGAVTLRPEDLDLDRENEMGLPKAGHRQLREKRREMLKSPPGD